MLIISQEQALSRWDTITEALRTALFSPTNSDFVWKLCESEHIPEQKRYDVAGIAGYVLLGFLHPEDLAAELRDALKIDIRVATTIADAINKRIFAPLRQDIDKVYEPILGVAPAPMVGPKILQEIAAPVPVGARAPMPSGGTPPRLPLERGGMGTSAPIPVAPLPTAPPPAIRNQKPTISVPPAKLSDIGWSSKETRDKRQETSGAGTMPVSSVPISNIQYPISDSGWSKTPTPTVASGITPPRLPLERGGMPAASFSAPNLQKTEMGKIEIPVPMPPRQGGIIPPNLPSSAGGGSASGGERGGMQPVTSMGPAPVMFTNEAVAKQIEKVPDFKMVSDDRIAAASKSVMPATASATPAMLEFSGARPPLPPKPPSGPRVVNYGDAPREQGRQVIEVTSDKRQETSQTPVVKPPVPKPVMPVPPAPKPITPQTASIPKPPLPPDSGR